MDTGELLKYVSHGVYIIGVSDGENNHAFTAAWVMQVSFSPVLFAISVNPGHHSYELLKSGGICSINVLSKSDYSLAEHFGQSGLNDKMSVGKWRTAVTGAPILDNSLVYFDCKVCHEISAGDHQLIICEWVDAGLLNKGVPMLYSETGNMDKSTDYYKASKSALTRRASLRVSLSVTLIMTLDGNDFQVTILDVSNHGLGFCCDMEERDKITPHGDFIDKTGKPVEVIMVLNLTTMSSPIQAKCRVIYSRRLSENRCQIGLAFMDISRNDIKQLQLINAHHSDS